MTLVATDNGRLIAIESVEDLVRLLRWRDANKDLVRNYRPMVQAGVIEYGEGGMYRQEFRFVTDRLVRHEYLAGGILKGFGFEYDRYTWEVKNKHGMVTFYPVDLAIQDMITVHASCMAVMQHARQFVKEADNRLIIKVT